MFHSFLKRVFSGRRQPSFSLEQRFQSVPALVEGLNIRFFIESTLMAADRAREFGTLAHIHDQVNRRCMELVEAGGATEDLHAILMHLRERIIGRVIFLCRRELGGRFQRSPAKYAWFLAGSEGRGEPSFFTDQDNLIVYEKEDKPEIRDYFRRLSEKINEVLHQVGFEACKGGVMARNEQWRGSMKSWQERLDLAFSSLGKDLSQNLKPLMSLSVLLDARFFAGNRRLGEAFLSLVFSKARNHHRFLGQMAQIATRQKVALTVWGRLRLVDEGGHRHGLDIKRAGILPLVNSIRLLALEYEAQGPGTIERTRDLERKGALEPDFGREIQEGFLALSRVRMLNQMRSLRAGRKEDDFVIPSELSEEEQEILRKALSTVEKVKQRVYKDFYLLMETAGADLP